MSGICLGSALLYPLDGFVFRRKCVTSAILFAASFESQCVSIAHRKCRSAFWGQPLEFLRWSVAHAIFTVSTGICKSVARIHVMFPPLGLCICVSVFFFFLNIKYVIRFGYCNNPRWRARSIRWIGSIDEKKRGGGLTKFLRRRYGARTITHGVLYVNPCTRCYLRETGSRVFGMEHETRRTHEYGIRIHVRRRFCAD